MKLTTHLNRYQDHCLIFKLFISLLFNKVRLQDCVIKIFKNFHFLNIIYRFPAKEGITINIFLIF